MSINQKQSAALVRVNSACDQGGEPSFIVEGVVVYVYNVPFSINQFKYQLELYGLEYRFSGESLFVFSPLY